MKKFVVFGIMGLMFCIQNSFAQDKGIVVSVDIYITNDTRECTVCASNGSYAFVCQTNGCGHDGYVCGNSHSVRMCDYHYQQCKSTYAQKQEVQVNASMHACTYSCNHDRYYNGAPYRIRYNVYGYGGYGGTGYCRDDFYQYNRGNYGYSEYDPWARGQNVRQMTAGPNYNQPWRNVNTRNATNRPRPYNRGR